MHISFCMVGCFLSLGSLPTCYYILGEAFPYSPIECYSLTLPLSCESFIFLETSLRADLCLATCGLPVYCSGPTAVSTLLVPFEVRGPRPAAGRGPGTESGCTYTFRLYDCAGTGCGVSFMFLESEQQQRQQQIILKKKIKKGLLNDHPLPGHKSAFAGGFMLLVFRGMKKHNSVIP